MKERRSLVDGMTLQQGSRVDRGIEDHFVRSGQTATAGPTPADQDQTPPLESQPPAPQPPASQPPANRQNASTVGRLPLSTRIRADYATALKRASLERQLNGKTPNTLQDILEEALGPWLVGNGYINPPRR